MIASPETRHFEERGLKALPGPLGRRGKTRFDRRLNARGTDNDADAFLDVARSLEDRTAQLESIWRDIEGTRFQG